MHRLIVFFTLLFSATLIFAQTTQVSITFSEDDFLIENYQDYITIKSLTDDYYYREIPGAPALPTISMKIVIPENTSFADYSVSEKKETILNDCTVYPTQPPVPTDGTTAPWVKPDPAIYGREGVFPVKESEFSGEHTLGAYRFVTIEFSPFRYYPAEKRLEMVKSVEVNINTLPDRLLSGRKKSSMHYELMSAVAYNSQDVEAPSSKSPVNANDVQYLIITDQNTTDEFQPLADWKTKKGVPAEVISVQTILSSYSGATDQLKIKACLQDYYNNKGLVWVLLGGDNTLVPDQDCYSKVNTNPETIDNTIPADLFYCCFDNQFDWNADGDDKVGELEDNIDMAPEIFIGRAPVQTEGQATAFVNKTLYHIQNPPTNSFAGQFVSCGLELWNTWGGHSDADWRSENMWNQVIDPLWNGTKYKYYDTDTDFTGGDTYDVTASNTSDILNDGYNFFWMATHGGQQVWAMESGNGFDHNDAAALTNNAEQGIIVTMACNTNAFETSKYTNDPCLSEAFLRNSNGGAVLYHGSSRYGWGNGSAVLSHGSSMEYARDLFNALFNGNPAAHPYDFAAVSAESKLDNIGNSSSENSYRWLMFSINNMGDPEMDILTTTPLVFSPTYPNTAVAGIQQNLVVNTGVPGALVCLTDDDNTSPVYSYGLTGQTGECTLAVTPNAAHNLTMTITAPDYIPAEYTITVVPDNSPFVVVDEIFAVTSNGDGYLEAGETATIDVRIINLGSVAANTVNLQLDKTDPDAFITINDNVETVTQTINSGDTLIVTAAFSLAVAYDVTNNYPLTLSTGISYAAKDMTWYPQDFTVYTDLDPMFLEAVDGVDKVSLNWRAPFGGWNSYYPGGGWLTNGGYQRAMLFEMDDFDLNYPIEISRLASQFYETDPWNGSNEFRFNILDAATEDTIYQTDWISAGSNGYSFFYFDYPLTIEADFYLSVEVMDQSTGYPVSVVSEPMNSDDTHCWVGEPGNWVKATHEYSHYIYVMDANTGISKMLSKSSTGISQKAAAKDILSGRGSKATFQGYNIYRDDVKVNTTPVTDNTFVDEPSANGIYKYNVTAVYAEGESCISNTDYGSSVDANTVYFDHFANSDGWTSDNNCAWGTSTDVFYSAPSCFTDSPGGDYQSNLECNVYTHPPVSMLNMNASSATVSFMVRYNLELDYDTCFFEVTTDIYGQTPEVLAYFTGNNDVWTACSYDISQYIGHGKLYFSWRIKTDQAVSEDGIYIDDFLVKVMENGNAPARFLEANIYTQDVHLSWAPPMAGGEGWFTYFSIINAYTMDYNEKGQYINLAEFGNAYPMVLEKVIHYFYDRDGNNWNGNNRYSIRIYNKNGQDLIFESEQLEATHWNNEYVLPEPLTLTEDVLISIKPVAGSAGPYSLLGNNPGEASRAYSGNADEGWGAKSWNWATEVYITNPVIKQTDLAWGIPSVQLGNLSNDNSDNIEPIPLPEEVINKIPYNAVNNSLAKNVLGYNIYRDGSLINTSLVTDLWYQDKVPHQSPYDYGVKAVYAAGESVSTGELEVLCDGVVIMDPPSASFDQEVTLRFNPYFSCQQGQGNSLEGYGEVRMHSGIGIGGSTWNNEVPWDGTGANSQSTHLTNYSGDNWSITLTPAEYFGVDPSENHADQLCMVFNGGDQAQTEFGNAWAKEGKEPDGNGGCMDIFIPLVYRDTLYADDFENGTSNWSLTGTWALTEEEFFSATHSLTDSPNMNYSTPEESTATINSTFDLTQKWDIVMEFRYMLALRVDDFVYIEASDDGFTTVETLYTLSGTQWKPWRTLQVNLNSMAGHNNVEFRFRLVTQNTNTNDGIYIDDLVIKSSDGTFMITELISHTDDGNDKYDAGESATIDVVVYNGGGSALTNIPLSLTKNENESFITITDNTATLTSLAVGETDTIFDAFALDVSLSVTNNYPFSLHAGADIPTDEITWFDFYYSAYSDIYPINLVAENGNGEVDLSWYAPFRGWYTYQNTGIEGIHWSAEERGVLYSASDFNLTYPLYFTTIAHRFQEDESYPWNGQNKFRYKIYDYATNTLIYETEWLYAPMNDYSYFTFENPFSVNGDFIVAVEVFDAGGSDFPSSARNNGTTWPVSHSYLGSAGTWTSYDNEWMTYLFVTGDGGTDELSAGMTVGYNGNVPDISTQQNTSKGGAKSDIVGFNIYRDGAKINGETPVDGYNYTDEFLAAGNYTYYATAVYAAGESCPSNFDNAYSFEEHVVFFEDFEGWNDEDWNCNWDFTTADAYSGYTSLANAPWGNYEDNQDCWVKTDPPISLLNINADSAILSFYAKYDIELDFDTCYVEISNDFWGGQREILGYFTGTAYTWQQYSFDISGYLGDQVVIIFRLKTDQALNFDGIYIDDIAVSVYDNEYAPARNFEAYAYDADIHLDWDWPMAGGEGWFSNWRWTNTSYFNPLEKASYIDIAEFGNAYPMQLTKIRHHFLDWEGNNWNGENEFKFKVYEKDGQTLIFESEVLIAVDGAYEYELPQPLELTDDVLVTVKPMATYPTSCYMNDSDNPGHGYLGSVDNGWASINGNWATEVYLANSGTKDNTAGTWLAAGVELGNTVESTVHQGKQSVPADIRASLPVFNGNQKLAKSAQGFNVFRDGQQINSALITNNYFYDTVPHQGVYDYTVKAVYAGGMSVGTIDKSMTVDDVVIMFPMDAAADDEVTLWFDPFYSCESGQSNSLEGSSEVRIHSGAGVNGSGWTNSVDWDGTGYDGTTTYLTAQPEGQYTITYTPSAFYGLDPGTDMVHHLDMVFNSGNSTPSPWDKEGKAPDGFGGCENINVSLNCRSVIFADDFESGTSNWTLSGSWALTDLEFFTATHSLTDTPNSWYSGTSETSATLSTAVDLSGYSSPVMEFNLIHGLGNGDNLFVEISTDDFASYTLIATCSFWNWKPWSHETIDMSLFENESNVKVRFRLVTDDTDDGDGVFIDDFMIKAYQSATVIESIPYTQDFAVFPTPDWNQFEGQLTASSVLVPYTGTGTWDGWHEDGFGCNGGSTGAIRGNLYNSSHYYWYTTPYIDLGSNPMNIELRFDMAGNVWNNCNQAILQAEDHFAVVISTDGINWSAANTLIEWANGDVFPVNGETFEVDLTGYSGLVKFGFYHGHNSSFTDLEVFVDNVYVGADNDPLTIAEARMYPVGTEVTVTGIVTNGQELGNIRYFQDATAGIAAYGGSQNGVIFRGDSVTYTGVLKDYNGLLEIDPINNMTVVASGVTLPDPLNIEPGDLAETIESQLITIDTVFFENPVGVFAAGIYSVMGPGSDNAPVYVRYSTNLIGEEIPASPVILKGIVSQYSPSDPNAGYQINLRDTDDLTPLPLPPTSVDGSAALDDVTLTWGAPIPGVTIPGQSGYEVYRNTGSGAPFAGATNLTPSVISSTSFIDNDLANNTYVYWVKTVYADGTEALSEPVEVVVNNMITVSGYVTLSDLTPVDNVYVIAIRPGGSSGTHTDASGFYSFTLLPGLDYIVKCGENVGYTFNPVQREYTALITNVTDADFTAIPTTVTISGNIADNLGNVSDVLISFTNGGGTATTDADGNYSHEVPYNYSGLATPAKSDYTFNPANRTYYDLIADATGHDYAATCTLTYTVSGTITDGTSPMEGVTVTLTGSKETALTGADGTYSFTVDHGFSGTITPAIANYTFAPVDITLSQVTANSTGNDFVGTPDSYPVSGTVTWNGQPLEGVYMNFEGISNDPTTASDGTYTCYVPTGWAGYIAPIKTGFTFTPSFITVPSVSAPVTGQDFVATHNPVAISGTITEDGTPLINVAVVATDDQGAVVDTWYTMSDGSFYGSVPYGFSGDITPEKANYSFTPAFRTYANLTVSVADQDFEGLNVATYSVSGTITDGTSPLEGVTVTLTGSRETTLTGSDGTYSFTVAHGYSGNLSASLTGYAFTPSSISLSNVIANSTGNDFVGSTDTYTVSGTVTDGVFAMEGVTITLSGSKETTLTASNGSYSFTIAHGFTGTLTPSYSGYVFTPESIDLVNVTANSTSNNFVGTVGEYSVSGTVTLDGLPLEGVLIDFDDITSDPVTALDGTYTCMVPTGWYGDITPALAGYTFTPEYLHLSAVSSNISGKDFAAAEVSFTISGTVAEGGSPIEGVDVTFENTTKDILQVVTTASDGTYSCDVPYNWSGSATPSKTDYTFDPESRSYTNVLADVSDEDYEGYSGGLPPGWGYVNTGSNHTLFVQATAPKIDGVPLSFGSWIGVFYDDNGVEKCAGAIEWQGASSPIIAAQGDDSTTPEKDGFSEGETITYKFYTNDVKGTELYASATYASGPQVYTTNGTSVIPLLEAVTSITQTVQLAEGWSGISSYIIPDNDLTAVIFEPVLNDFVILKSMTLAYWPPYANQLEHWNSYEGYKLKMDADASVDFVGSDSEKTLTMEDGWCLLPVLTNQSVDATTFFAPVIGNLIIAKTIDGMGVYWPSVGVQTLTSLTPGESYMAKFSAQSTMTYPPLSSKAGPLVKGYPDPVETDVWPMPQNTGITHTITFTDKASEIFETGDLLGVFDNNDRCVGIAEVSESHNPVVSVYGDDQTTVEKDGMFHNETFVLKVYHVETETIDEILVEYDKQYNIAYCDNGMSVIVKTTSTTGIGSMNLEYTRVFPNPATDKLFIHVPGGDNLDFNARILSANGGSVLAEKTFSGRTTLNIQTLPAGVYMIEITDGISAPVVKRIIKN